MFVALVFAVSSCSDSFLDKTPTYALNEDNVVTDYESARYAVSGIYTTRVDGQWSSTYSISKASQSGFTDWYQGDYLMNYSQSNPTTSNIYNRWKAFYETVNVANFAITNINNLSEDLFPSEADRLSLLAEARFWRAWAYLNIFWNYGHWWSDDDSDVNGVLYREIEADLDNLNAARLNVGESYQKIYDDLDFAIANLNGLTSNRYISKEFAKVIKAKALLRRAGMTDNITQLNESLALVNDVLETPPEGFVMQGDLAQVYQDSWDSNENLFVGYLENDYTNSSSTYGYSYTIVQTYSDVLDVPIPDDELTAGLVYGADWFREDPRWDVVTGESHSAVSYDSDQRYTWTKLTRLGKYDGDRVGDYEYNTYYFRFPELYIMKSELLARTGASIANAIAPINTMRSIRTNPILSSLNPVDQQELMDYIFKEYFFETFLEQGNEFYTALRFKTANGEPWIVTIKGGQPLVENAICYPIPDEEMITNNLMTQNPDLE